MTNLNFNGVTSTFELHDYDHVTLTRQCPWCKKEHSIKVSIRALEDGCAIYGRGARIQEAFPTFSVDEREFLMTGICPTCWNNM